MTAGQMLLGLIGGFVLTLLITIVTTPREDMPEWLCWLALICVFIAGFVAGSQ